MGMGRGGSTNSTATMMTDRDLKVVPGGTDPGANERADVRNGTNGRSHATDQSGRERTDENRETKVAEIKHEGEKA